MKYLTVIISEEPITVSNETPYLNGDNHLVAAELNLSDLERFQQLLKHVGKNLYMDFNGYEKDDNFGWKLKNKS